MQRPAARVLIVDDSALIRQLLRTILESDRDIEVVDTAADPLVAREKIKRLNPDVVTLDIEMPRMDGLAFLEKLMALRPMPVVMVSSLTQRGADATIRALELGAVDFVAKPRSDLEAGLVGLRTEIVDKVKAAARIRVDRRAAQTAQTATTRSVRGYTSTEKIVAIGASTGGVEALNGLIAAMPPDCPAIMIAQHMPEGFTASFAKRLDSGSPATVVEAEHGQRVLPGHVYLAPGNRQLELGRSGANYVCVIQRTDRVSGHCPSVDVLFNSVAQAAGANAVGAILTGMGKDGAQGLLAMRRAGARTLGQDEATSLVYGMPRAAFEVGAVEHQVPLGRMAQELLDACGRSELRSVRV